MFAHPSVYATRTRPCLSTDASLKSSRFRHGFEPPPFQMQPRWTGSPGVALTVVQVLPPSNVYATNTYQTPGNAAAWSLPALDVPRNANAARSSSPATTSGNFVFWIPYDVPTSTEADQVLPWSWLTAIRGWPSPASYP